MRSGPLLSLVKAGEAIYAQAWNQIVKLLMAVSRMTVSPPLELIKDANGWALRYKNPIVKHKVKLQGRLWRDMPGGTTDGIIVDFVLDEGWVERGAEFIIVVAAANTKGFYFEDDIVDVELQDDGTWQIVTPGHYFFYGVTDLGGIQGELIDVIPGAGTSFPETAVEVWTPFGAVDPSSMVGCTWDDGLQLWVLTSASCVND